MPYDLALARTLAAVVVILLVLWSSIPISFGLHYNAHAKASHMARLRVVGGCLDAWHAALS